LGDIAVLDTTPKEPHNRNRDRQAGIVLFPMLLLVPVITVYAWGQLGASTEQTETGEVRPVFGQSFIRNLSPCVKMRTWFVRSFGQTVFSDWFCTIRHLKGEYPTSDNKTKIVFYALRRPRWTSINGWFNFPNFSATPSMDLESWRKPCVFENYDTICSRDTSTISYIRELRTDDANPRSLRNIQLSLSSPPLVAANDGIGNNRADPNHFSSSFPPWRCWIPAFFGFIVGWWGWHNIRNDRRLFWGTCSFILGLILWGYGFSQYLAWFRVNRIGF
jgi:hypothetical protein